MHLFTNLYEFHLLKSRVCFKNCVLKRILVNIYFFLVNSQYNSRNFSIIVNITLIYFIYIIFHKWSLQVKELLEMFMFCQEGDQHIIVGAASKGIIQRDHQHNAVVYRQYYAANPFENMSEDEVTAYKQAVERQDRGVEPGWLQH